MANSYGLSDWLEYLSHKEIDALKHLASLLPENPIVVNIGAGCGTSALALLESRPDLTLYTIDIKDESSPLGCLEGELIALENSGIDYKDRYHQVCGDSKTVEWNLPVNMVFVDGDHTYDGCKGDIKKWLVWTMDIMVFHDYRKPDDKKPHRGVDEAVDELMTPKYLQAVHVDTMIAFYV